jgi:hypothetical protein
MAVALLMLWRPSKMRSSPNLRYWPGCPLLATHSVNVAIRKKSSGEKIEPWET